MRPSSSLTVTCERCGQQHIVERAGRFRDEDYYELWHESQARILTLEQALQDAEWRMKYLAEHRDALALVMRRIAIEKELEEEVPF